MASPAVRKVLAALVGDVENVAVDLAVEIQAELIDSTPVDTSFAANSWINSIGQPDSRVAGSRDAVDPSVAPASAAEVVRQYRIDMGSIFVSNHADYIEALWNGSSDQGPPGWGEAAIARAVENVRRRHA